MGAMINGGPAWEGVQQTAKTEAHADRELLDSLGLLCEECGTCSEARVCKRCHDAHLFKRPEYVE